MTHSAKHFILKANNNLLKLKMILLLTRNVWFLDYFAFFKPQTLLTAE